ncbi:hypothetical protein AX265_09780 [Streptococcus agalactiae]|uniref:BOW99_gp33 family protein n=1 Tax=Streptococcus agalactiae TaxID=1311 RepID=UPI0008106C88|nr:hypothetical protein [Streptococcus agalactiae]OCL63101.1 hypothetical protein AX265_09780 [Streptococcus agalactiae]
MAKEHYIVTHVMSDGTELDDIKGCVIPDDNPVYDIFRRINQERWEAGARRFNQLHGLPGKQVW